MNKKIRLNEEAISDAQKLIAELALKVADNTYEGSVDAIVRKIDILKDYINFELDVNDRLNGY